MNRRSLLACAGWLPLAAMVSACASTSSPSYLVTTAQLEAALAQRFPLRYQVPGLVELNVAVPRLQLLPQLNRIASEMTVEAAGPALVRSYTGEFGLDFALRYEPSDRSIRARGLKVRSLRLAGLPADAANLLQAYAAAMAQQNLPEVVLHRVRERDLALPGAMGLQPGDITVTAEGLRIGFVNQRAP